MATDGVRDVGLDEVAWAVSRYDVGDVTEITRVSADEPLSRCHLYRIDAESGQFALKVYPRGWWSDRLYRAHATMEFLSERGYACPRPLRTIEGDRVCFLGERPAMLVTWLEGVPLWDGVTRKWREAEDRESLLCEAMRQLALVHRHMTELPLRPTRVRPFPPIAWYDARLRDLATQTAESGVSAEQIDGVAELVCEMRQNLAESQSDEKGLAEQHVLVDCHPGQFLFEGDVLSGLADFDHVATASPARDVAKFVATDDSTLRIASKLIAAYLAHGELPPKDRQMLPDGIMRYVLVRNIQAFCEVVRSGDSVDDLYGRYMGELATLAASLPFVHLMLGGSGGL